MSVKMLKQNSANPIHLIKNIDMRLCSALLILMCFVLEANTQHSVARQWNDKLLEAIRSDFARPTVHARNLWHTSAAMYDAWAIYNEQANLYLFGDTTIHGSCTMPEIEIPEDDAERLAAQEEAIAHAAYTILIRRFINSPNFFNITREIRSLMDSLGYDYTVTTVNYEDNPSPAVLGNIIGSCYLNFHFDQ